MGILRILMRAFFLGPAGGYRDQPRRNAPSAQQKADLVAIAVRVRVEFQLPGTELVGRCWVIDGDTIDIAGTRIRLAGIDAPELDHPYGYNAKWALVNLCKGTRVRAVFEGDLSHDRNVATCYLPDGRDLSAEMVKLGMAIDWPKFSKGKYSQYEPVGVRRRLWRADARQKGRMPPLLPD